MSAQHTPGEPPDNGMIRRTKEMDIGCLVEELYCYATDKMLSDIERQDIIEWTRSFEECSDSEAELQEKTDEALICAAYFAMADYAKGQM